MSIFGRKGKKEEDKVKEQEEEKTPIEEARISSPGTPQQDERPKPKPDPKFEHMMALLKEFHAEYGIFTSDRFGNEDVKLNLLFGLFCELRKLNKLMAMAIAADMDEEKKSDKR